MSRKKVVIVTGMSGSGKSTVARTLEDIGYYCVDNLPVDLVPKFLELAVSAGSEFAQPALVIDLRQRKFFPHYSAILDALRDSNYLVEILFLDARDDVLIRRYSETRRQHPMAPTGSVTDGIARERKELAAIKGLAQWTVDTSDMTVHQLRDEIQRIFAPSRTDYLKIVVGSFGFGKGLPMESDLILDVRFLPNPHFVEALRRKDGRDDEVREWVMGHDTTKEFLKRLDDLIIFLLPLYIREGKQYLTISIGCTGGRHRSVVVAMHIAQVLKRNGYSSVEIRHREIV